MSTVVESNEAAVLYFAIELEAGQPVAARRQH
jgi:hypothetical protein